MPAATMEEVEAKATAPRGPRRPGRPATKGGPVPVTSAAPAAPSPEQLKQVDQLQRMMGLMGKMLARLPVTAFGLIPPLTAEEEATMGGAWIAVAEEYMPRWLQTAGPLVMLAGTATMVYGDRIMDKLARLEAARKAAQEKAHAARVQTASGESPLGGGPIRMGEDLFSAPVSPG